MVQAAGNAHRCVLSCYCTLKSVLNKYVVVHYSRNELSALYENNSNNMSLSPYITYLDIIILYFIANLSVVMTWLHRLSFQAVLNAPVSVDSFFLISGLLSSYLLLTDFSHRHIGLLDFIKTTPLIWLHRYLR